jgi:hypothetical protein
MAKSLLGPSPWSEADLATLSLLDPDQGVCPEGHECRLDDVVGYRRCTTCTYRGRGLICWEITSTAIDAAERGGAAEAATAWARSFVADR